MNDYLKQLRVVIFGLVLAVVVLSFVGLQFGFLLEAFGVSVPWDRISELPLGAMGVLLVLMSLVLTDARVNSNEDLFYDVETGTDESELVGSRAE